MSLHTDFFKETRSLIIASASGLFLYSQALPAQTPEKALPEVSVTTSRSYAEPQRLPVSGVQIHPLIEVTDGRLIQVQHVKKEATEQRLNRLYGNQSSQQGTVQPVQVQPVLQTPPAPIRQTAGSRVPRKSLFDRLVGKIKGDANVPAGPPQDPGMKYTTVTEAQLRKTQAPQLVQQPAAIPPIEKFTPPPVPGVSEIPAPEPVSDVASTPASLHQPRSFPGADAPPVQMQETQQSNVAKAEPAPAIPDSFIPPLPGSDEQSELIADAPAKQSFPELKAIMEAEEPAPIPQKVAVTPEPAPVPQKVAVTPKPSVVVPPPPMAQAETESESVPVFVPAPQAVPVPKVPIVKSKPKARPLLDLNGPLPLLEDVLAAEKAESDEVEPKLAEVPQIQELEVAPAVMPLDLPAPEPAIAESETPMLEVPVPEVTAPQVAEVDVAAPEVAETKLPVEAAATAISADPLANPFPADVEMETAADDLNAELLSSNPLEEVQTAEAPVEKAPAMPPLGELEVEEAPYSGLALEEDLFLKGKVPAPAEPSTMLSPKSAAPEVEKEETGFAKLDDRAMPELPPFPSIEEEQEAAEQEIVVTETPAENEELTPSKEFPQLQSPETEQRIAMAPPKLQPRVDAKPKQKVQLSKMELIASRKDQTGLKGFCPVQLRDTRDLVDVDENYSAIFNNKKYSFSNSEALQKFIADPEKYAPAIHGSDVIHLSLTGEEVEGTLDYAVWFKGRLYLFTTAETMETFVAAPNSHATHQ